LALAGQALGAILPVYLAVILFLAPLQAMAAVAAVLETPLHSRPAQMEARAVAGHIVSLLQARLHLRPVGLGILRPQFPRRGQTEVLVMLPLQTMGLVVAAGLLLWAAVVHLRRAALVALVLHHLSLAAP
jgi:hypothetical protein